MFITTYHVAGVFPSTARPFLASSWSHGIYNSETFYRQMSWAGNIAKTMASNGKQFTVTPRREKLTAVALDFEPSLFFPVSRLQSRAWCILARFARRTKKKERLLVVYCCTCHIIDHLFVSGNIEIRGKQNGRGVISGSFSICALFANSYF